MFGLGGAYETQGDTDMLFSGVNRTVRELKTSEWLDRPGGECCNGWYENLKGDKLFYEVMSTQRTPLDVVMRDFDILRNSEHNCNGTTECGKLVLRNFLGPRLSTTIIFRTATSVTILNKQHTGVFLSDASLEQSIKSVYDLETILANASLGALLIHWLITKIAMLNSYRSSDAELQAVGIGVLSCACGFQLLSLLLLPRLKMDLAVFCDGRVHLRQSPARTTAGLVPHIPWYRRAHELRLQPAELDREAVSTAKRERRAL